MCDLGIITFGGLVLDCKTHLAYRQVGVDSPFVPVTFSFVVSILADFY